MAIKINGKEYDENKFDDKTKNYVIARQELVQNQVRLEIEMEKVNVLIRYYNAKICEFLGIDPKLHKNLNQKINQKNSKNGSDCKFKNRPRYYIFLKCNTWE